MNLTGLFCRKLCTPSLTSLLPNNPWMMFESRRWVASALSGPLYMRSLINLVEIADVLFATSSANSNARARVASGLGRSSEKSVPKRGLSAVYTAPVVVRCSALECPIKRGRKKEEQASMMMPRLANTKPILALEYATRMHAGRHIVIPTPTADP